MELKGPIYLGLFPPRKVLCLTLCLIALSLVNKSFVWFTDVFDEHLLVGNNDQEREGCQIVDECKDNRAIVDNNEAQTLTSDDIDEMRR